MKVKLTIVKSSCRCGLHKTGESFIVEDLCVPICAELWNNIYANICVLKNGGDLDYGESREKKFLSKCPDNERVEIIGELL